MPSKIQVDQIAGATGSTVTLPSGQTLDLSSGTVTLPSTALSALNASNLTSGTVPNARLSLTSSDLPTVPTTKGGTGLTTIGTAAQVLRVNSGATALEYGSVASNFADGSSVSTGYGLKAWINFNGNTNNIRGSGNVSSITDNGTGDFRINFTTAMPDANYGLAFMEFYSLTDGAGGNNHIIEGSRITGSMVAGSVRVLTTGGASAQDHEVSTICVYR
jgi:hypothetical protein